MFEEMGSFDEAFAGSPVEPVRSGGGGALKKRKTIKQVLTFWGANGLAIPVIGLIYATIIAEGLRVLMPIFEMRLYRLPLPGCDSPRLADSGGRYENPLWRKQCQAMENAHAGLFQKSSSVMRSI